MINSYQTSRLTLKKIALLDAAFILELVNTSEWKQFIGDRNVNTPDEAIAYIGKIMDNPNINYWVVKIRNSQVPIGIITFIKRDYLDYYDIGFAFLKQYTAQGYAFEATAVVLNDVMAGSTHKCVQAITTSVNKASIQLLKKLGFRFENEMNIQNEILLVYSMLSPPYLWLTHSKEEAK